MDIRICRKCKNERPITAFSLHSGCVGGRTWTCSTCNNTRLRERRGFFRKERAEARRADYAVRYGIHQRALEAARMERKPFQVQAERLSSSVRDRCRERNLPRPAWVCTAEIEAWIRRQPNCVCCGVVFHIGPKHGRWRDDSPSFDRFDSSGGYELQNVSLICWRCNNIKRNYVADDLRRVAAWMDGWGLEAGKFDV